MYNIDIGIGAIIFSKLNSMQQGVINLVKLHIRQNTYYDSVSLMLISKELKKLDGVNEALVGMGTDLNKEISQNIGLSSPELAALTGNDFFVAVDCVAESQMEAVLAKVEELLNQKKQSAASDYHPATLDSALKMQQDINMAVVSVPGAHAAGVVRQCLEKDINVLLFSDNVTIEEEKELKELAVKKELLMMGPDCGTAIVNHVPLAFANVVRPGNIGIVAASGTGTQEVSSIIDQLGGGVTQVLGTGGRDLRAEIGGLMFSQALAALAQDEKTEVIVLISKPPAKEVQTKILKQAAESKKPTVVCFIGGDGAEAEALGLTAAVTLEDAARKAVALAKKEKAETFEGFTMGTEKAEAYAKEIASKMAGTQKYMRGLYTGGTLCDESMKMLSGQLGHIYSNIPLAAEDKLPDKDQSREHTCLDFGDDEFTVGRPHPMIDPSLREERILKEGQDESTAVILLDCVIGYGSHENPAPELADAIKKAIEAARGQGRELAVVVSVCGTDGDPQSLKDSRKVLEEAGAAVMPSNAQAARMAGLILAAI